MPAPVKVTRLVAEPVLDVSAEHAEAAVWDAAKKHLLFVDIPSGRVFVHEPLSARTQHHALGRDVSDVHPTTDGRLVVAVREGIATLVSGRATVLTAPLETAPGLRMNDGNVDPAGRLFVGSMAYDYAEDAASLYRISPDGELRKVLTGITISNGVDWSPEGDRMYYVDSPTRRVDLFDYDVGVGLPTNRRTLVSLEPELGLPDGLTVDAQGGIWVALFGGGQVRRFTSEGRLDCIVEVPGASLVTSCCLGGPTLNDLYITTSTERLTPDQLIEQPGAGRIYRACVDYSGKAATPFGLPAQASKT